MASKSARLVDYWDDRDDRAGGRTAIFSPSAALKWEVRLTAEGRALAFEPSGSRLAVVTHDQTIWLWDTSLPGQTPQPIQSTTRSGDVAWLDNEFLLRGALGGPAIIVDLAGQHRMAGAFGEHSTSQARLSVTRDRIATAGTGERITLWCPLADPAVTDSSAGPGQVRGLGVTREWVVAGDAGGEVTRVATTALGRDQRQRVYELQDNAVTRVAVSASGRWAAIAHADGAVRVVALGTGHVTAVQRGTPGLAFGTRSPAFASDDRTVLFPAGREVLSWRQSGPPGAPTAYATPVLALAAHPKRNHVAVAESWNGRVTLDRSDGERLHATLESAGAAAVDLQFSPDGQTLLGASSEGRLYEWRTDDLSRVHHWLGHAGVWVNTGRWSPDGTRIVSAGDDGLVHVWDRAWHRKTRTYRAVGPVSVAVFGPDGRRVYMANGRRVSVHRLDAWQ